MTELAKAEKAEAAETKPKDKKHVKAEQAGNESTRKPE